MSRRHAALVVALLALAAPSSAPAEDIAVTTTEDDELAPPAGSLRAAIAEANDDATADRIVFAIPGTGVHTITPVAQFDNLTTEVDVDATTQPGYAGTPLIQLSGANMAGDENGFLIQTSGAAVRGFAINGYPGAAILVDGNASDANVITGNHLGVDPSGVQAGTGSDGHGVRVLGGDDNLIEDNVISGHALDGIALAGSASRNRVEGNRIGTNLAGTAAIPNGGDGVDIENSDSSVIGGDAPGAGNLIAFNDDNGVAAGSVENTVLGNAIHSNGRLGIDIGVPGADANDDGADNGTTNHPLITNVDPVAGGVRVRGTLRSDPNEDQRVEIFSSEACDPSGSGEGARFVGRVDVTTAADGTASFDTVVPGPVMRFDPAEVAVPEGAAAVLGAALDRAPERILTATATDPSLGTSEFSPCATLPSGPGAELRTVLDGRADSEDLQPGFAFGPLTFEGLSAAASLPTAQDSLVEGPETVRVELTDPVGGSLGTPPSVLVTILDDDEYPPPLKGPFRTNERPDSSIDRIPRRVKASKLTRFRGRASDDAGVLRVDLAVLRLGRGAKAAAVRRRCGRLRATGRLRRVKPRAGRCRPAFVLRATGTTRWTYRLKRKLPKGSYVVFSRAIDGAGKIERSFTRSDGNRRAFRVV